MTGRFISLIISKVYCFWQSIYWCFYSFSFLRSSEENFVIFLSAPDISQGQSNSTVVSETNWKEFVYLTLFFPLRRRIYFSLQFGYYSMIRPTFSSLVAYYVPKCWVQKHVMAYITLVAQPEPVVLETELIHGYFYEGSRLSKNIPRSIFILVNCHFCFWILKTK